MGGRYVFQGGKPSIADRAVVFDSAEISGDVVVGEGCVIGARVHIIGDPHGQVRIGDNVQILPNAVLHLLPDRELVISDDVTIGSGSMLRGCRIGAGSVVEAGTIVCEGSRIGAGSLILMGSCLVRDSEFGPLSVLDGIPAAVTDTLLERPARPSWAFNAGALN